MVECMSPNSLRTFALQKGLNRIWQHPITHSRIGWPKGRTDQLWEQLERCCMTKAYHFICGLRHAIQQYTCRTKAHIVYWGWRHQWKPFSRSDQMWVTSGSSVYFHVTKDAWKKLDPTAELGILVGYTDTPHNYQVFLPTSQRKVVRRDLNFDE